MWLILNRCLDCIRTKDSVNTVIVKRKEGKKQEENEGKKLRERRNKKREWKRQRKGGDE